MKKMYSLGALLTYITIFDILILIVLHPVVKFSCKSVEN